ncbi:zinc finger protein DZIP1L [Sturnira hondurensis]|uniref:zinc finger protein DZIP1L n=1 Tax=Sturnira hondurensis TaxID=192404 RepID=UPI00187AC421|nr:zinc finger protein DZIP1L [Sturnira hondurensis]
MQFLATIAQGSHHSIFGTYTVPPFRFLPRNRRMDWRRMSVLDVGRVTREMDVATLQENLTDIAFCTLDQEVCSHCSQPLDQALLNVLSLAQLTIEYLMHGQDFLMTRVTQLELHLQASQSQQSQSQQELDRQAEELRALREERHRQRKMIKDLQQLLQWSGGQSYYMCHLCEKTFRSASSLQSHLQHRHEGAVQGGERKKQEESMEEVVQDLRAQLTSTQEELTALLKKQRQQQVGVEKRQQETSLWMVQSTRMHMDPREPSSGGFMELGVREAKTACQRERDAKAMFEEWKEELSEEIDQQKQVFWDELKSSVLPKSPLEEKPAALQSPSVMGSNLESLQDVECEELLRQIIRLETLRILKEMNIQLQDENRELQRENKTLRRENNKLQEEKEKMQKENEKLQRDSEKLQKVNEKLQKVNEKLQKVNEKLQKESEELQKENERLHDMLCQLHITASQSQQHIVSLSTQMQQQARLITSQEMVGLPLLPGSLWCP